MAKDLVGTVLERTRHRDHETRSSAASLNEQATTSRCSNAPARPPAARTPFYVMADDYVTTTDGTGIVHNAPAFGEDDYRVCREIRPALCADGGHQGRNVRRHPLGRHIRKEGRPAWCSRIWTSAAFSLPRPRFEHSYPFCWRCDTPLIYYARSTWFISHDQGKGQADTNTTAASTGSPKPSRKAAWATSWKT